jgi:aquacobalamin reductase/NAD(P)H-flavin reductase
MSKVNCQVKSLTPLTDNVYKVLLTPEKKVDFLPGQYLNFVMSDDDKRPFSIASSPTKETIELQIGAFGADSYPMQVIDHLRQHETVTVELAFGDAYLRTDSDRPLLLIAGGTGFSYVKSMLEYLVESKSKRPVLLYWGLREINACYELAETQALIDSLAHASFIPVIENTDADWQGRVGIVHEVVLQDIISLEPYDIYLAGRFEMIGKVRNDFIEHGALLTHMYADAFAYI